MHTLRFSIFLYAVAFIMGITAIQAQEQVGNTDEIVVSGSKMRVSNANMLSPADIISQDDIATSLTINFGDMLSKHAGIANASYGQAVGRPVIRGLSDYRVAVFENNLHSGDISASSPDHIIAAPFSDAKQIEVIKGAATLRYGPYAGGGIINILDSHLTPSLNTPDDTGFVRLGYSSVADQYGWALETRFAQDDDLYTFSTHAKRGNDYDIPGYPESEQQLAAENETADPALNDTAENTAFKQSGFKFSNHISRDVNDFIISVSSTQGNYGIPGHSHAHEEDHDEEEHEDEDHADEEHEDEDHEDEEHADESDVKADMKRHNITAQFDRQLYGGADRLLITAALTQYEHEELENNSVSTSFENITQQFRGELFHSNEAAWSGILGVSYLKTDGETDGDERFLPETSTETIAGFLLESMDRQDWLIELAFRLERTRHDQKDYTPTQDSTLPLASFTENAESLSAGLGFRNTENSIIGSSLSYTNRVPSITELFAEGPHIAAQRYERGNADLTLEQALAFEAYYRFKNGPLDVNISLYHNEFNDFIYANPTGETIDELSVFDYMQQDATISGTEFKARFTPLPKAGAQWSFDASVSTTEGTLKDGNNIPQLPPLMIGLGARFEVLSFNAGIYAQHAAKQTNTATHELPTDAWTRLDFDINWRPALENGPLINAGIRNITDEEIRYHTSAIKDLVPEPGRDLYISVSQDF